MKTPNQMKKLNGRICRVLIKQGTPAGMEIVNQIGYRLGVLSIDQWEHLSKKKFKRGMRLLRNELENVEVDAPGKSMDPRRHR